MLTIFFCRALLERFEFLSGRWYELRDVRKADDSKDVVEGEDAADVKGEGALAVEFRCLTCNSNQVSGHFIEKVEFESLMQSNPNNDYELLYASGDVYLKLLQPEAPRGAEASK